MSGIGIEFAFAFEALTDYKPLRWQKRLFDRLSADKRHPERLRSPNRTWENISDPHLGHRALSPITIERAGHPSTAFGLHRQSANGSGSGNECCRATPRETVSA